MTPDNLPERVIAVDEDGQQWLLMNGVDGNWIELGIAPAPTTVWQTFIYHFAHGLLMRYPLWDVLKFSWQNRRNFIEAIEYDGELATIEYVDAPKVEYTI